MNELGTAELVLTGSAHSPGTGCSQLSGAFVRLSEARPGITERILEMNGALEQVQSAQSLVQVRRSRARSHALCVPGCAFAQSRAARGACCAPCMATVCSNARQLIC